LLIVAIITHLSSLLWKLRPEPGRIHSFALPI
jgi:hypothetical protein